LATDGGVLPNALQTYSVNFDIVAQILVAAFGVISATVPVLGNRQRSKTIRVDLKNDMELLAIVPDGPLKKSSCHRSVEPWMRSKRTGYDDATRVVSLSPLA
jgi:hypothetical protein